MKKVKILFELLLKIIEEQDPIKKQSHINNYKVLLNDLDRSS